MTLGDQDLNREFGELPACTAPSFEAFYEQYQDGWVRYAYTQIGSRDAAEQITDALTAHMAETWHHAQPENAAYHAWKVLKASVARWLDVHGTGSAIVETGVFERVARVLERFRDCFAAMEESLGLYSAISRLPKRQYESIVLRFVLDYPYSTVAVLLGVPEDAVRANVYQAKKRLAEDLGVRHLIEIEA